MNKSMIINILGKSLMIEAILMLFPAICGAIYQETVLKYFLFVAILTFFIGFIISFKTLKNKEIYAKESFVIVALVWIIFSLFGCLPFYLSGEIPSFIDAFFETVSGFTTTGATILNDVEKLSNCMILWRSFTQWIGGMGILIFVIAILPKSDERNLYLLKAEAPGPNVTKVVSKIKLTAQILYVMYVVLTLIEFVLLLFCNMPIFDSLCVSFSTMATGGFAPSSASIAYYSKPIIEYIIVLFMFLGSINFSLFYLLIMKQFKAFFKNDEIRIYMLLLAAAVILIAVDTIPLYTNLTDAFRNSLFTVTSISTTTGFVTYNYNNFPQFSQTILIILMFIGGCAGSTSGGLKVSRVLILIKGSLNELKRMVHTRGVYSVKTDGNVVKTENLNTIYAYCVLYLTIIVVSWLVVAFNGFDFTTSFTSVVASLNNIGPALGEMIGALGDYSDFSVLSKTVLCFDMLAGRLELIPILLLFLPSIWKKN